MSDMAPTNGAGPPLAGMQPLGGVNVDSDQTEELVAEVQKTIVDAAQKARGAENGGEFKDYASGVASLISALYPKGGEISSQSAQPPSQTGSGSGGSKASDAANA